MAHASACYLTASENKTVALAGLWWTWCTRACTPVCAPPSLVAIIRQGEPTFQFEWSFGSHIMSRKKASAPNKGQYLKYTTHFTQEQSVSLFFPESDGGISELRFCSCWCGVCKPCTIHLLLLTRPWLLRLFRRWKCAVTCILGYVGIARKIAQLRNFDRLSEIHKLPLYSFKRVIFPEHFSEQIR